MLWRTQEEQQESLRNQRKLTGNVDLLKKYTYKGPEGAEARRSGWGACGLEMSRMSRSLKGCDVKLGRLDLVVKAVRSQAQMNSLSLHEKCKL